MIVDPQKTCGVCYHNLPGHYPGCHFFQEPGNLRTEHEIEIDKIHDQQLQEKNAEIERLILNHEKEKNILLTSLEVTVNEIEALKALITELANELEMEFGPVEPELISVRPWALIVRARDLKGKAAAWFNY